MAPQNGKVITVPMEVPNMLLAMKEDLSSVRVQKKHQLILRHLALALSQKLFAFKLLNYISIFIKVIAF